MPALVEVADHLLELGDLLAAVAGGGVGGVGCEERHGVVAPVVRHPTRRHSGLAEELVHREQLHRADAEVLQIADDRVGAEPGVGAAQVLGDLVVELGEALDVQLVDDGVAPPVARLDVVSPVEGRRW